MTHLSGLLCIRIVAAEPEIIISKLLEANIYLKDVRFLDLLTMEFVINRRQIKLLQKILCQSDASYKIIKEKGLLWKFQKLANRKIFLIGVTLFIISTLLIPGRIFFVETSGNESIPSKLILFHAEICGLRFGVKSSDIHSEEIKNKLLNAIPQLQWVGIETSGSRAIIHVTERSLQSEADTGNQRVTSIVAAKDGVITQMTVERGTPLFYVGQSVKENETIVSGYTDCGLKVIAESAEAEVFAHTFQTKKFVMPIFSSRIDNNLHERCCYKLRIGKKVINLCNHSGISDVSCVKMYSENYWTLPGDFQLPVSLIQTRYLSAKTIDSHYNDHACMWLMQFARSYLQQQMIAGEIMSEETYFEKVDGAYVLTGEYSCNEMIGQVKYEENIGQNAEDN